MHLMGPLLNKLYQVNDNLCSQKKKKIKGKRVRKMQGTEWYTQKGGLYKRQAMG